MSRVVTLSSVLVAGLASFGPGMTRHSNADDAIEKKVVEVVKQTGELYKNAKSFHVEGTFETKQSDAGDKPATKVKAIFDIEKPKLFALKTEIDGDPAKGPEIIADGKKLTIYGKSRKQYTEEDSPGSLGEIGLMMLQIGPSMTGMLFANVLQDDPADALMDGVTACSYVGKDTVDGTPVHRMKFSQDQFNWEMWVAAEGKPYILRMIRIVDGPNSKLTTTETYKNWKLDGTIAKDTFKFSPPEGVTKVDEFEKGAGN
jgi:hypothetical protein